MKDNINVEVIKAGKTGLFCNYIFKAIPLAFDESMSYYECLCGLLNYLKNTIIPSVNNNADAVAELQELFTKLQNFVNNYFDNLDVQDEINKKLDQMVEAGTLQEIIADYLNSKAIFGFDNVQSMKEATNLIDGSYAKTLGYYEKNDGGGATYKIRTITTEDINNELLITLNDELVAELIIEDVINFKQLGARSYDEEFNKVDSKPYIDKYLSIIENNNSVVELFIPAGVYFFSETILDVDHVHIKGVSQFDQYHMNGTVIAPLNNNQEYIWLIGSTTKNVNDINYKDLYFTGYNITHTEEHYYNIDITNIYNCNALVKMYRIFGGFTDNLVFMFFKGKGLEISSTFEVYFKLLNFRHGQNINGCILNFANTVNNKNISACNFEKIMFEAMHGDLINVEPTAYFGNNYIGVINFEDYSYLYDDADQGTYTDIDDSYNDNNAIHHNVINIEENAQFNCEINSIELNQFSFKYYTLNNQQYIYDTIFKYIYGQYVDVIVNNINIAGIGKNARVLKHNEDYCGLLSSFIFNNIQTDSRYYSCYFDVNGMNNIFINNIIDKTFNIPKLIYNKFTNYKTNLLQDISGKNRGNIQYQSDSINNDKLCINMINPSTYPAQPRLEVKIPVLGSKLHIRCKSSNTNQFTLVTNIINGSSNVAHKYFVGTGTDTFTWYTIDYSSEATFTSGDIGNYICELYASDTTDANIILDCFFWE